MVHRVAGYDKVSERLELERDVPPALVMEARQAAEAPADVRDAPGAFPLGAAAVTRLSELLGFPTSAERYDWFLEPFAG